MERNRFGRALRKARLRAGLSQADLAARAGVTGPYVSQLESGQRRPLIGRRIVAMSAALGIPPRRLQREAELERSPPSIRRRIETLDRERRRLVMLRDQTLILALLLKERAGVELPGTSRHRRLFRLLRRRLGRWTARGLSEGVARLFEGISPPQRHGLLRDLVGALAAASSGVPAAAPTPDSGDAPPAGTADLVAIDGALEELQHQDWDRVLLANDLSWPRAQAGDLVFLEAGERPREGHWVFVENASGGEIRRVTERGDRPLLESVRPEVPPIRWEGGGAVLRRVRALVRLF